MKFWYQGQLLITLTFCLVATGCTAFSDPSTILPNEDVPVQGTPCEEYCSSIDNACTGANAQYSSQTECLAVCASFNATGQDLDVTGNTLQCRVTHANLAAGGKPDENCAPAGPTGNISCIDEEPCALYCAEAAATCTGPNAIFPTDQACMSACARYAVGLPADQNVDSLQCRLYHLGAAKVAPSIHCVHASEGGGGVCVSEIEDCLDYCGLWGLVCGTNDAFKDVYPTAADCRATCATFPQGIPGQLNGDTFACRATHLDLIFRQDKDPNLECPNGGADGAPACTEP